jgi:hypothetical protein
MHQSQYVSHLGYFHKMSHCDVFIILDDVQFQKNGFQNRNQIKSSRGWQWLTVPVQHHFGEELRQVRIARETRWGEKHWNALKTSYGRAPFFNEYAKELEEIYARPFEYLNDLNIALIDWATRALEIPTPLFSASEYGVVGEKTERLINLCRAVGADCYFSGQGAKEYMDLELFRQANIRVIFQEYTAPEYEQVFAEVGFVPNLSVLDTLFCCGREAKEWLT